MDDSAVVGVSEGGVVSPENPATEGAASPPSGEPRKALMEAATHAGAKMSAGKPKVARLKLTVPEDVLQELRLAEKRYADFRTNHWQGQLALAAKRFLESVEKVEGV